MGRRTHDPRARGLTVVVGLAIAGIGVLSWPWLIYLGLAFAAAGLFL